VPEPSSSAPSSSAPSSSTPDDDALARRLRAVAADGEARPLLVALDFDGTLAPLQDDPWTVRVAPGGEQVLARLGARPDVVLALVSGRSLDTLAPLAPVPVGTVLVAGHGAERGRAVPDGLERTTLHLAGDRARLLVALHDGAWRIADEHDGVWVEAKPTSVVVHTRRAEPGVAAAAQAAAHRLGETAARVLTGKDVVELMALPSDKGSALAGLRAETGARAVLYAGDDVTDEHAFEVLGPDDVAVKVGAGPSSAAYRVADPVALVAALVVLADALDDAAGALDATTGGPEGRG
jgi:trehalose-phosphatase